MMFPPSLPAQIRKRAFFATNGELGILPDDASVFVDACRRDSVEILGWELWVVDHFWGFGGARPEARPGVWSGAVPFSGEEIPQIVNGDGAIDDSDLRKLLTEIEPSWLPYVRVNFTL